MDEAQAQMVCIHRRITEMNRERRGKPWLHGIKSVITG